ncbi:hypothetical protein KQI74_19325 [Paenibacillus barcinonensis]|jgi:hypothetical protein|uniref:hypothetical protein n=1 Tax=Paenibacillus barcinonensis TaxID=198119 RepID=UPI001C0FD729|nr:hypothetical protein [Paenibacillus barcinonensis]MBU5354446.1 hypothetical protein [Paenibacillus barcinonensis]
MLDEREIQIKERIQERYDIMGEFYTTWFTKHPAILLAKDRFYQKDNAEKHRAITYLLDKGYIIAEQVEHDPKTVAVSITPDGIDFYEQGYLDGTAKGFQVVANVRDKSE